ncbi:hypothetical protein ACOSQ2_026303 [Xanthoceras sorbifolium]
MGPNRPRHLNSPPLLFSHLTSQSIRTPVPHSICSVKSVNKRATERERGQTDPSQQSTYSVSPRELQTSTPIITATWSHYHACEWSPPPRGPPPLTLEPQPTGTLDDDALLVRTILFITLKIKTHPRGGVIIITINRFP